MIVAAKIPINKSLRLARERRRSRPFRIFLTTLACLARHYGTNLPLDMKRPGFVGGHFV